MKIFYQGFYMSKQNLNKNYSKIKTRMPTSWLENSLWKCRMNFPHIFQVDYRSTLKTREGNKFTLEEVVSQKRALNGWRAWTIQKLRTDRGWSSGWNDKADGEKRQRCARIWWKLMNEFWRNIAQILIKFIEKL